MFSDAIVTLLDCSTSKLVKQRSKSHMTRVLIGLVHNDYNVPNKLNLKGQDNMRLEKARQKIKERLLIRQYTMPVVLRLIRSDLTVAVSKDNYIKLKNQIVSDRILIGTVQNICSWLELIKLWQS